MIEVREGDSLFLLPELDDETVDLVLTDPPYSSGGQFRGDRQQSTTTKYVSTDAKDKRPDFLGDNRDQRAFLAWCTLWMLHCFRVLKPGALIAVFTDWRQLPTVSDAVQCAGFVWRGVYSWCKPVARPCLGRPTQSCEFVVWATKGPREVEGESIPGYQLEPAPEVPAFEVCNPPRERKHQTQKPIKILRPFCRLVPPGGLILDPFCGSGATLAAAALEGRDALGFELSPHYAAVARAVAGDPEGTADQPDLFGSGDETEG